LRVGTLQAYANGAFYEENTSPSVVANDDAMYASVMFPLDSVSQAIKYVRDESPVNWAVIAPKGQEGESQRKKNYLQMNFSLQASFNMPAPSKPREVAPAPAPEPAPAPVPAPAPAPAVAPTATGGGDMTGWLEKKG
jgi:hypothetical protein